MLHAFQKKDRGGAIILTGIMLLILSLAIGSFISIILNESSINRRSIYSQKAFYLAEAGIQVAAQRIYQMNVPTSPSDFQLNDNSYLNARNLNENISVTIAKDTAITAWQVFNVTSTAIITDGEGDMIGRKIIDARIVKDPPSKIFDYVYFLNNWGYAWGSSISMYGDMRSNGHFGVKYNPTLNGNLLAAGNVHYGDNYSQTLNSTDVNGLASDPDFWHPSSDKLAMPNLYQMQYYRDLATAKNGKIWIGAEGEVADASNTLVDGIYGDDAGEGQHLILASQGAHYIHIDGPVVIEGNVIIRGKLTGKGCIYSGKNIYLAGDVEYANPADYDNRPWDKTDSGYETDIAQWVENNNDADLIGFAAQENIVAGNWDKNNWHPKSYQGMWENWGAEDAGQDGIPFTNDAGEDDGTWDPATEDIDEDGVYDNNYSFNVDIIPCDDTNTPLDYEDFDNRPNWANNYNAIHQHTNIKRLDGIYYTNHLFAAGTQQFEFHGSLVSRDEAIVYSSYLNFNYDDRIHSKFRDYDNFDLVIDIPRDRTAIIDHWEIREM